MVTIQQPLLHMLEIVGIALTALLVAAVTAVGYRWYLRERVSTELAVLVGLSVVALYLNVKSALGEVVAGETAALSIASILYNGGALVAAALVIPIGIRLGDRVYRSSVAVTGARSIDGEVSRFVRTVGRLVAIELPEEIDDLSGYDPIGESVKAELAGTTLLFPRGLTVDELRDRLELRLTDDFDIGTVDFDLEPDGTVSYLAVGRHQAGLGPTLGPGTAAVAITADPPYAASAGDFVQLWSTDSPPSRVATGELRATAGDVVTLALDNHEAVAVAGGTYRLATLPTAPRPDREFGGLLRAANATLGAVTIDPGSGLSTGVIGAIKPPVIAVQPVDAAITLIPDRTHRIQPGDTLYVVARPEVIRRLETGADPVPERS